MAKISYASLKLKTNTEVKTFDFNGNQIEVLQYLPISDKYTLLNITLQEAQEGAIYNPIKKDMCFHLNLVFMYSNINFTDKQKEDLSKLYDVLQSNGLLNLILENIPENEYSILYEYLNELESDILSYKNTISGTVKTIIDDLPLQAEEMQKIVDNFDANKFKEVINFARAINNKSEIK